MLIFSTSYEGVKINMSSTMTTLQTRILKDNDDIVSRLEHMSLEHRRLIAAGGAAMAGRGRASALHSGTAKGTFTYHDGVEGLRAEIIGRGGWSIYSEGGLEGIVNDELKLIVLVKTVDRCCSDFHQPRTRPIGANSEKICKGASLFEHVGADLPAITAIREPGSVNLRTARFSVYYLMIDPQGRLELSMPVFEDKKIKTCVERIYLVQEADLDPVEELPEDAPQGEDDFVIEVKRKNEM